MKEIIRKLIQGVLTDLESKINVKILVDYPKNEQFGDYSTNVAIILAKKMGKSPIDIAKRIISDLQFPIPGLFEKVEAVEPGYINFYLSPKYFRDKITEINDKKEKFGDCGTGKNLKVNNEFISANPTGPLQLGNGRGGFYGDVISNVLRKAGYEVINEYYVNDGGGQVLKLGHSVLKDSDSCYQGDYIDELNKKYGNSNIQEAGEKAAEYIVENIIKKSVKEKMKISYNLWVSERSDVVEKGYVEKAIEILKNKKMAYEKEGALWFRTTAFGDDKDRVLIKSDGKNAYFASDCGYFLHKIERGFDRMILILGADHNGYMKRMYAAAEALGFKGEFKFIITQLVGVIKDGKVMRMSKRAGNVVYVDELIDKVGHDVTRFFLLMYSPDTHMNFDLGLAEERSQKNPVFYVQYAHARICSILSKAGSEKLKSEKEANLSLLNRGKEIELMRELNKFPELVEKIGESYEVHKLPHYAIKLADKFHSFYDECRVIDEAEPELTRARIELISAARIVLAETLRLIGVGAPARM